MEREIVIDSPRALAGAFAARFETAAREALATRGRFACAVPGGSVAKAFFPALRVADVDWRRVEVFFTDERAVPPEDPASNHALARGLWLDHVPLDPARVHRMPADRPDLDAAAEDHAREMARVLGDPPRLDLALLGVGPDGHVCSLFPGHGALRERSRLVAAVSDSPKPPPRRLTLTLPALAAARRIALAAFGPAKAAVIREAVNDPASTLPVALVARCGPPVLFLLDPPAAGLLTRR
jgi:6-phosphogluconolactonase